MVVYKLTYFPMMGRAELLRMLFAQADVKYEDVRVPLEDWPKMKADSPFGQLPILEIDGVKYCQSEALSRHLARKFGLAGKTELEQLRADMIMGCMTDVFMKLPFEEKDEKKKAEGFKKAFEDTIPPMMKNIEGLLVQNKDGNEYVTSELTATDIGLMMSVHYFEKESPNVVKDTPKLVALTRRVEALPRIAAWIKARPKTDM